MPSLQLRDRATGATLATAFNYASHPESLADDNRSLTSDFPHYAREAVEERYGGVAIYVSGDLGVLQGPLGVDVTDPLTGQPAPPRTFRKAEVMGELLAERVIEGLEAGSWEAERAARLVEQRHDPRRGREPVLPLPRRELGASSGAAR